MLLELRLSCLPVEGSVVGILVGGDGVRPVVALHLGLEPVDSCLPSRRLLNQPLPDSWTLAGSCHQHLDSLIGAATVRALAAVDEGEKAVDTVSSAIYHQVKSVRLDGITEGLQHNVKTVTSAIQMLTIISTMIVDRFLSSEEFEEEYNFMSSSTTSIDTL